MDLAAVMVEIAAQLTTISGLRCHDYPVGSVTPPGAVVGYPTEYEYDVTGGRGMDRMMLPLVLVVGRSSDRAARDELARYVEGSGPRSIKAVLEAGTYAALDSLRVQRADFDVYTLAATDYISAIFDIEILGPGS